MPPYCVLFGKWLTQAAALLLICGVLLGIRWMGSPQTAVRGNRLNALCMACFIFLTLFEYNLIGSIWLWASLAVGGGIGLAMGMRARMIQMPELVALLNGFGGAASAIVAWMELLAPDLSHDLDIRFAAGLGIIIGAATLSGSLVAAAKLARWISQRPLRMPGLTVINGTLLLLLLAGLAGVGFLSGTALHALTTLLALLAFAAGAIIVMRVGGADMPVTISLLNSLSGVAVAFAGFTLRHSALVAVGGIVGAAGLVLTQIMCRAMNRNLADILTGRTTTDASSRPPRLASQAKAHSTKPQRERLGLPDAIAILRDANRIIIIPGYGMAVAQAQQQVKALYDRLEQAGKEIGFAIHPVAGRMPGHMHVLLAETQIPYEKFMEMDEANPQFKSADAAVVVGANDVINPAANTAEGTPIYGMPVLDVAATKNIIICNLNAEAGYAGVHNPLYDREETILLFGDAKQTVGELVSGLA